MILAWIAASIVLLILLPTRAILSVFFGKFYVFIAALNKGLVILSILGVLASVISAYYYLRIIKVMYFDEINSNYNYNFSISYQSKFILVFLILIMTFFVFYPSLLISFASSVHI